MTLPFAIPTLTTARLTLRPPREADLASRADHCARISARPLMSMVVPANQRSVTLAERLGARFERTDPGEGKPFDPPFAVCRHPGPGAQT